MSCSPFELKDYFLKELPEPEGRQVEAHLKICQGCREELERLQITEAALCSLRDEEVPQRIAFVSDPVFEPSPWRRWLAGFWNSAARLGFASAAMLAGAIVFHGVHAAAPAPAVVRLPGTAAVQTAPPQTIVRTVSDADIQTRVDAAVARALRERAAETRQMVADLQDVRRRLIFTQAEYQMTERRFDLARSRDYSMPPQGEGERK